METENAKQTFENLPTGKPHVSFSEVKLWKECSYRHQLIHIKKLDFSKPSPILAFGTSAHAAMESFLLTREMNVSICFDSLEKEWKTHEKYPEFTEKSLSQAKLESEIILKEVPEFFEKEFPGWEVVDAEHMLYEGIEGHPTHAFKGFIDGVIKTKGKRGETLYWIIDHKTTARGWFRDKRSDDMVKAQLALYKNYWCQKNPQVSPKDVRCGFVLLKKSAKPGEHCELFAVPLGDVPIQRSLKVVSSMITSVKRGISVKNRDSCTYCEFKNTEHCV
jgi:hypothetical protein